MPRPPGVHSDRLNAMVRWAYLNTLTYHRHQPAGPRPGTVVRLPDSLGGGRATVTQYLPQAEAVVLDTPYYLAVSVHALTPARPTPGRRRRSRHPAQRDAGSATSVT
jgi:hypothetical protein